MKRLEVTIVIGFAITFVAGLAVGMSGVTTRSRSSENSGLTPALKPQSPDPQDHFPNLGKELNLTPDEKQKMEAIWKDAHPRTEKLHQAMAEDDQARAAEIQKLLTPEQLHAYEEIQRDHDAAVAKLRGEIRAEMDDTHKKIRTVLTSEQAEKFDQMAKERGYRHGPPPMGGAPGEGFGPPHHHHHGPDTAATRPDTAPAP